MKREISVLLFLTALLGYLIYDSLKEDPSKMPTLFKEAAKGDTIQISKKDTARFEIRRDDYIVVVEQGRNGRFMIRSPVSADVDRETLKRLFSAFEKMNVKKTLRQEEEEIPIIMSEYGLDNPRVVLKFYDAKNRENTFLIGKESKEKDGFFAKWAERDEILLLDNAALPALDVDFKAIRNKDIFSFEKENIKGIAYGSMMFEKNKEGWHLLAPVHIVCDRAKMDPFVKAVSELKSVDFLRKELKVEQKYKTAGRADFLEVNGVDRKGRDTVQKIVFGRDVEEPALSLSKGAEELMYVFKGKNGYIVKKDFLKKFQPQIMNFTDERMVPLEKNDVSKISVGEGEPSSKFANLERGEHSFAFEKKLGNWEVAGHPQVRLDNEKIERLVDALVTPAVSDFIPFNDENIGKVNLLPPQYQLKVNDRFNLALSSRTGDAVYFLREDNKNVIGKGARNIFDLLSPDVNFYRSKKLLRISPDSVMKISLTRNGKEVAVERIGNEWLVTKPVRGKVAEGPITNILKSMANLNALDFVSAEEKDTGLADPVLSLSVSNDGKEHKLFVGKKRTLNSFYASLEGAEGVFILSAKNVKPLETDLLKNIFLVETDSNNDGAIDSWTYFDKGKKTKLEVDINNDGKADVVSNFVYGEDGTLLKVEADNNGDGKPDQTTYFAKGIIEKEESDADFNGTIDSRTYFKDGKQNRSEIDVNGDGKPDMNKIYLLNEKGELAGAEVDDNMDGKTDYRERYQNGKIIKVPIAVKPPAAAEQALKENKEGL